MGEAPAFSTRRGSLGFRACEVQRQDFGPFSSPATAQKRLWMQGLIGIPEPVGESPYSTASEHQPLPDRRSDKYIHGSLPPPPRIAHRRGPSCCRRGSDPGAFDCDSPSYRISRVCYTNRAKLGPRLAAGARGRFSWWVTIFRSSPAPRRALALQPGAGLSPHRPLACDQRSRQADAMNADCRGATAGGAGSTSRYRGGTPALLRSALRPPPPDAAGPAKRSPMLGPRET
jgi:hypothetical protein